MVVRDVVRTKNRIKSMYRSRGVAVAGKSVYSSAGREPWQEQLPEACRGPVRTLYAELDGLEEVRDDAEKALVQEARKFPKQQRKLQGSDEDLANDTWFAAAQESSMSCFATVLCPFRKTPE